MRVAIIYNEPKITEPADHWLFASMERADPAVVEFRDGSELGVVESMEEIKDALQSDGHEVMLFNVDGNIWRLIDFLRDTPPDAIFNLCESVESESTHEAYVAGIYELLHIPYTGAPPAALTIALNKHRAKEILLANDLPTPRHFLCASIEELTHDILLRFPLIVKPSREDASIGIDNNSVVYNLEDLRVRVNFILERFQQPALIEEFIDGRELNVAVLGNDPAIALPISEIDFSTMPEGMHRIVTYEAKWMEESIACKSTVPRCPAPLDDHTAARVRTLALRAVQAMECRDYTRVDMRLNSSNEPFILEVNPNPDLSSNAGFIRAAGVHGLNFEQTVRAILECAIARAQPVALH